MNDKVGLVAGVAVGVLVIGGLLYFAFAPVEDAPTDRNGRQASVSRDESASSRAKRSIAEVEPSASSKPLASSEKKRVRMALPVDWFADLPSAKDRSIAKHIQDAQDAGDSAAVLKAADEALRSSNEEVRRAAVDALSLQGSVAIPTLLKFTGDKNADVADAAYHAWDDAVDLAEEDYAKLKEIHTALPVLKSEEHITMAVGKIEMLEQSVAIHELAMLARNGGKAEKAAMKSYENITGEPFVSWENAELKAIRIQNENAADSPEP